jgi:hypothetical protein
VSGPIIIERAKSSFDEMKKTGKCTFSVGWLQSNKNYLLLRYVLFENVEYLIIQRLTGPFGAALKNSTVHNILRKYF